MAQRRITSPGFRDQRYKEVIERLKLRRKEIGLSQQKLAERLGLHKQFISRVELGERRLDIVEFADLARALELDPAQIVGDIPGGEAFPADGRSLSRAIHRREVR